MQGIEPGAFHMQSERSTTELHPLSDQKYAQYRLFTDIIAYPLQDTDSR